MLCNKCNLREATFHSTININGHMSESHLCEICALSENKIKSIFNMGTFFSNNNDFGVENEIISENNLQCNICGTTYNEFLDIGLLGCKNCYKVFANNLKGIISSVQPSLNHKGKKPNNINYEIDETQRKIKQLEFKLRQAVVAENYELASTLKKEIINLKESYNREV